MRYGFIKCMLLGIGLMIFGIALGITTMHVYQNLLVRFLIRGMPILGLIALLVGLIWDEPWPPGG